MEFLAGNILHEQRPSAGRLGTIAVTATHRVRQGTAVTPGYREVKITEQDPEYLSRKMPIERFYADWSASSAGRSPGQSANGGMITLLRWDRDVLKQWKAAPYSF